MTACRHGTVIAKSLKITADDSNDGSDSNLRVSSFPVPMPTATAEHTEIRTLPNAGDRPLPHRICAIISGVTVSTFLL